MSAFLESGVSSPYVSPSTFVCLAVCQCLYLCIYLYASALMCLSYFLSLELYSKPSKINHFCTIILAPNKLFSINMFRRNDNHRLYETIASKPFVATDVCMLGIHLCCLALKTTSINPRITILLYFIKRCIIISLFLNSGTRLSCYSV